MIIKKLDLREERNFGQKFDAVFSFVQANFKSFLKVIVFSVGPLALIGSIFFGMFYSKIFGMMGLGNVSDIPDPSSIGFYLTEMGFAYLFLGLASLWMVIAVYSYMVEYDKGNDNITVEAVWNRGKNKILPTIGFGMLVILAVVLFTIIIFAVPGNSAGGIALKALIFIVALFYVMVTLSLTIPIMVIEDADLFQSIGRSFSLISGKWWSTFGLMFVMGLVVSFATGIFAIPFYVTMIVSAIMQTGGPGELVTILCTCIMFVGSFLMSTLPALAIGFQYFNLVERKEGTGLLKKIDQVGKPQDSGNEGVY